LTLTAFDEKSGLRFMLLIVILGFFAMTVISFDFGNTELWLLLLYFLGFGTPLFMVVQFADLLKGKPWPVFTLFCLITIILVFIKSTREYKHAKSGRKYLGTEITFSDSSRFVSRYSVFYIGKTENFLFIYHDYKNAAEAISMSEVKSILMARHSPKKAGGIHPGKPL
jgi:hypothetical protein